MVDDFLAREASSRTSASSGNFPLAFRLLTFNLTNLASESYSKKRKPDPVNLRIEGARKREGTYGESRATIVLLLERESVRFVRANFFDIFRFVRMVRWCTALGRRGGLMGKTDICGGAS